MAEPRSQGLEDLSMPARLPAHPLRLFALAAVAILAAAAASAAAAPWLCAASSAPPAEAEYLAESDTAMRKMMREMSVPSTGDVDRDFVAMMVPHHQGAIDMAVALLRYGRNEQLRRLAQEIIVTQQQEIAAMRLAVGEQLPAFTPALPEPANGTSN
jgi:uncharacterized protein (DUF305 family)